LMIVRTDLRAGSREEAQAPFDNLCAYVSRWGVCRTLRSDPVFEDAGHWKMDAEVRLHGERSVTSLLKDVTSALASGPWEVRDLGPDESFAVWDERRGGRAVQGEVTWLLVEFLRQELGA
jgi:hypothetical protein